MSALCDQVVGALKEAFPHIRVKLEHFVLYRNQKLFVDIFVPQLGLAIEVHGRQHDEFVKHFHSDADGFRTSKKRDALKEEWASENGFTYIVLREHQLPITTKALLEILGDPEHSE